MKTIKKRMCVIIITHIFARNQIFLFLQIKRETKLTVFERFQSHTAIMPGAQLCKSPFRQKSYICFLVNYRDKIVVLLRHLPTFNWRIHILINLGGAHLLSSLFTPGFSISKTSNEKPIELGWATRARFRVAIKHKQIFWKFDFESKQIKFDFFPIFREMTVSSVIFINNRYAASFTFSHSIFVAQILSLWHAI